MDSGNYLRFGNNLRAFGASSLGLPVVVAWAILFVSICARRHTQALGTALLTEKHAWLLVCCSRASGSASWTTFCVSSTISKVNLFISKTELFGI